MKRINVLTAGFNSPNGRSFLFPLVVHRRALSDANYFIKIHQSVSPALLECDILLVDSKFYRSQWKPERSGVIERLGYFREQVSGLIYCDTTDSTGTLQVDALPVVDLYAKAQLLKNRSDYGSAHYGQRIYTHYYHKNAGVADLEPSWSLPVKDDVLLEKLVVSWNSSLADYSLLGPARMSLYGKIPLRTLLSFPKRASAPTSPRPLQLHARMGTKYGRASVSYQRRELVAKLGLSIPTDKLTRYAYWRELSQSQSVLSPFGLGEITLKDYEAFLAGSCLIKPDMSHMETWPDLFQPGETISCFDWNLKNFDMVIASLFDDSDARISIAATGQENYQRYLDPGQGSFLFVEHFTNLISKIRREQ